MQKIRTLLLLLLLAPAASAEPVAIHIYPGNGRVTFTVPHLLSSVDGSFENFHGTLRYDPNNLAASAIEWEVQVGSVETGNSVRDNHLRSAAYFDPARFPTMSFVSQSVRVVDAQHLEISGKFTLRGVSKSITVPALLSERGFESEFTLNRADYGFTGGRPAVGDKVEVHLQLSPAGSWFPAK